MRFRILFHLKWLFKKRYMFMASCDPAIIDKDNIVIMRYDRKYRKYLVLK